MPILSYGNNHVDSIEARRRSLIHNDLTKHACSALSIDRTEKQRMAIYA
jgi:hypothetical protein